MSKVKLDKYTIGIDARLYSQTGVGTYIRNLLYYLSRQKTAGFHFNIYILPQDRKKIISLPDNFRLREAPFLWHSFNEQVGFFKRLYADSLDLVHFTYFGYPVLYKKPFIATIHDLTPLKYKTGKSSTKNIVVYNAKHMIFKYVLKNQIHNSKAIITPTFSVKKQILDQFKDIFPDKIHVLYEGVSYEFFYTKENTRLKERFNRPFFIYVGNFYPHKNVEKLILAFSKIKTKHELILIGPQDYFFNSIKTLIDSHNIKSRVRFYTGSTTGDLMFFYKNAEAIIHPSLQEGFGLPLIEAAYFNCPIIASDIPVFKELFGKQYLSFNQDDIYDIAHKINHFIDHKYIFDYSDMLCTYSFLQMTTDTFSIYQSVLKSSFSV